MSTARTIDQFAQDLVQSVISEAGIEDAEQFRANAFTAVMLEYLTDLGAVDGGQSCFHKAHGLELSGYDFNSEENRLDLFTTIHTQTVPPQAVPKSEIEAAVKRALAFFKKCQRDYHRSLEESSPVYDMAMTVGEVAGSLSLLRVFVLTDGVSKLTTIDEKEVDGVRLIVQVWDIERLHRAVESGLSREPITVDFVQMFNAPLPCLGSAGNTDGFRSYLAVIPGAMLATLYSEYGTRLLERNVRAFLQTRGGVNKGIRNTILKEPSRFLAYNNGISVTAEAVEFAAGTSARGIQRLTDFQIVNGGQTTASLYHAMRKDKADLAQVSVQMKLTVVPPEMVAEVVPLISRYANTQNRIQEADFSVSHPFHIKIEQLSRTIWAPATDGSQRQTRWFYERARGQYQDAKGREQTPARQRAFLAECPPAQMFTKIDLAKVENTWDQLPHVVSLGGQKNFREFMVRLDKRGPFEPDQKYFERLIAKLLLFRKTEKLVTGLALGGYRANVVTYALAYVFHHTGQQIDLDAIWGSQSLPKPLSQTLLRLAPLVYDTIDDAPGGGNVTEYCKREACWERIKNLGVALEDGIQVDQRVSPSKNGAAPSGERPLSTEEEALVVRMGQVSEDEWFGVAKWAKDTNNLQGWQRKIAFSIGKRVAGGTPPSIKQAVQGEKILDEARRLGFRLSKNP